MSNANTIISLVRDPVERFLRNQLSAVELVRIVDDLVAQDRLDGLDARLAESVGTLHEALALYVPDERTMREEPGIYIGEEELRQRAMEFLANLRSSGHHELEDEQITPHSIASRTLHRRQKGSS